MRLHIRSEVDHLERVVVHCPGEGIVRMTQHDLGRMLFDDLLSPRQTQLEHQVMREILGVAGAEVLEIVELLQGALERAPRPERRQLLRRVCELAGTDGLDEVLVDWPADRLARGLTGGIDWHELEEAPTTLARLRASVYELTDMALRPVPNLMFMRDPAFAVGDRVVVSRMATAARARESHLVVFALRWGASPIEKDPLFYAPDDHRHAASAGLEGGDVLVLSDEVLLIGCSERTSPQTIEQVAREALFPTFDGLQRIYAVLMPQQRSLMHLDTILTQIDHKLFLGHRPLVEGQREHAALPVCRIERDQEPAVVVGASVIDLLREEVSSAVSLVPCGGEDPLYQEREQWTDGANAVAVSPGHVILYGRNVRTIETLAEHGFEEVKLSPVQSAEHRGELVRDAMERERVVFSFTGSELSRARGGGRCLTMPLARSAAKKSGAET